MFITAEPITNLFARGGMEEQQLLPPRTAWLCVFTTAGPVCVFITAGPITKLCEWGRRIVEDMCYGPSTKLFTCVFITAVPIIVCFYCVFIYCSTYYCVYCVCLLLPITKRVCVFYYCVCVLLLQDLLQSVCLLSLRCLFVCVYLLQDVTYSLMSCHMPARWAVA